MENILVNLAGTVRREMLQDREHLVVPLSLIVPGILNGSRGPLLYPPDEVAKDPSIWNNIPIVLEHPTHNGAPVSARTVEVLNTSKMGVILRAKFANNKLVAEGWFDVDHTRKVDNGVLASIENGNAVELSTGLFTENEPNKTGETFNGQRYDFIARNYKPDHLAILPNSVGACSIADGCGVLVNKNDSINQGETKMAEITAEKKTVVDNLITNCSCWEESDRDILNEMTDDKLLKFTETLKKPEEKITENKLQKEFTDSLGNVHTFNQKSGEWFTQKKEEEQVENTKPVEPPTAEEWMKAAPVEIQEDLTFARNEKAKQKTVLINSIVANVKDDTEKEAVIKVLNSKSIDDLNALAVLAPEQKEETATVNYAGAAGSSRQSVTKPSYDDAPLEFPTLNFSV